ncbi:hypothetical protein [Paenibacillus sp. JDR-2]|uniref:hypothetical protein n=1 Tax=Paenibacillus sp. (strain JDR-2) TaxID=324057 RepID=UPI0001664923|nr:hypothetical protein [Paenibacillus sp. JDR-2]ACT03517.1 hypothetical protein Pjdr2_4906 [Paenibacillus sp. JDR-2]
MSITIETYINLALDAQENFLSYKKRSELQVSRWEFTDGKRYSPCPYWFERNQQPVGRVTEGQDETSYGKDENGLIWVSHQDSLINVVAYYEHLESRLIIRSYNDGKLVSIEDILYEKGRPIRYIEFNCRNGLTIENTICYEENYNYNNEALVTIKALTYQSNKLSVTVQYNLFYDLDGQLDRIIDQSGILIYIYLSQYQAEMLYEEVCRELPDAIKQVIKQIAQKTQTEKICYLNIYATGDPYTTADAIFHPALERIRIDQLNNGASLYSIWNVGNHPIRYQAGIDEKSILNKMVMLYLHWSLQDWDWHIRAYKIWFEAIMKCNQIDWSKLIYCTDDFIIVFDDGELDLPGGDLAKFVPTYKLDLLRTRALTK